MASGLRTVQIRFTGDSKSVARAAKQANDAVKSVGKGVSGAAGSLASSIGGAISGAIDALPPQGKLIGGVLVAGLATYMAPVIGAAVSSAVLLGLGGGVLALGIKSASDSPKVKAAFKGLKKTASDTFEDFGKPFEKPLANLAGSFGKTLEKVDPAIQRIGKLVAPIVDKIGPAVDGFAEKAMPGIEKAVAASVPLFETLADKLPEIGESVGVFFDKIAASGPEANTFFSDFLDLVSWTIEAFGTVIGWLASFYVAVRDQLTAAKVAWIQFKIGVIDIFGDILDAGYDSLSWIPGLEGPLRTAKEKFAQFRSDANAELAMIKSQYQVTITAHFKTMGFKSPSPGEFTGRASGGPVRAGGTYLVGERGPEVLTMGGNGWVTNNRELQQDDGGVTEIHVHLADDVTKVITMSNRDLKRRTRARNSRVLA